MTKDKDHWEFYSVAASLVRFCWPDGKWRGEANMKGLLPYVAALRFELEKHDPDSMRDDSSDSSKEAK
jgi:hypothetical protein